jgi:nucleotide-binding universal stress UspA family protein
MGERIVVGVDNSTGGREALAYALREGGMRGAEVEVIGAYWVPQYWPSQAHDADAHLNKIVAEVRAEFHGIEPTAVRVRAVAGDTTPALLEAAHGAQLLVVGSRGHGGFTSMLVGSVSLQCVLHAGCSVTVVRPTT